ncbi:signal transduction histidine kinase [Salinibacter ruber]|nr:signal transduction histidine kinase [Salinibacter ruber]
MDRLLRMLRRRPWAWGVGLGICVGLLVTAGLRTYAVQSVAANVTARQEATVEAALATIQERFEGLRDRLHDRAEGLAADSTIRKDLRAWREQGTRPARLAQYVAARPPAARTAIEVYAPNGRVLAWAGPQVPVDSAQAGKGGAARPRTAVVRDGRGRWALAAWAPVTRGGTRLGAVRVVRVVRYRPPVQNRYVQATSLEAQWSRATGELVRVRWSGAPPATPHRALRGRNGAVLGYASVEPPPPDRLVDRTAAFYTDLLAAGAVGLLGWVLALGGHWYLRLARRPGLRRHWRARRAAAGRLALVALLAVGARYAMLALDVPARWVGPGSGIAPLFNPTYFASTLGGGLFRSIGDLLLTGVWAAGLATGVVYLARHYRPRAEALSGLPEAFRRYAPDRPHAARYLGTLLGLVAGSLGAIVVLAFIVRRAVFDSTLDFFARTGLLPEPLVLGVLCGLFLLVAAGILVGIGGTWGALRRLLHHRPRSWPRGIGLVLGTGLYGGALAALYLGTDVQAFVSLPYVLALLAGVGGLATYGLVGPAHGDEALTLRGLLGGLFAVTLLLYPLLYAGMDAKRQEHMVDAARSFERGQDPRVLYSVRRVLRSAAEALGPSVRAADPASEARLDSIAPQVVRESLLSSLATYEVRLSVLEWDGTVRRQYTADGPVAAGEQTEDAARRAFAGLWSRYGQRPGPVVEQLSTGAPVRTAETRRVQYAGLLGVPTGGEFVESWVLVRIEPQSVLPGTGFGLSRVLLPDGSFGDLYADLSLAEFRDGRLVRSVGEAFGRVRLRPPKRDALRGKPGVWRNETVQGREYLTHYRRFVPVGETTPSTVAVRIPATLAFDHLYYLLRLTVAGLCVGLVVYLLGLYVRHRRGRLPASRVRFRNKVLNAFLVVGIVSMVAVGVVGVRVVTGENERAIERRMHDQLTRVEETLALAARPGEPLWRTAERMDVDTLAARVGLDLHLYDEGRLARTSQPRLRRDGLVDERLPGDVYHELYDEAYRFVTAEGSIGQFRYRVGYRALVDETGRPRVVVGVPTLAQQEQLQEEKSRTLAYLFGALLLLVVVVMLTGVVLANALARPIAQLREGLEAVGEGRFTRTLSVDTRDEVGDLVQTFNEMRDQLAESRRKLARQERELAWREMARQVAHEIKNPLTPMKLSIQHLRRAFTRTDDATDAAEFAEVFDRITSTLVEQVESLVRIADEFSTFARLPTRVPEPIDLVEVVRGAASLMEEEAANAEALALDLPGDPLVVEADREELRRVYINLLKNALQALPDDREGRVRVTARREENAGDGPSVYSEVIDNGTGIPPEVQDKVFEPNFSTKTSGTGLGLAIAQKSIDELGGAIGYETTEGEGTTFWIRLPLVDEPA